MGVKVGEASDADLPITCEFEARAYADNAASPALFPGPHPPNAVELSAKRLVESRNKSPNIKYIKAFDEESGSIFALSSWHFYETAEAAAAAKRPLNFGPGSNQEACMAFFGEVARRKERIMANKPHIYLHLLHTDPAHQGRGAASALIKWGLQRADELGLPVYLESSPAAHKFYKKHGFEDIELFSLDLSPYGGSKEPHVTPIMIREPKRS